MVDQAITLSNQKYTEEGIQFSILNDVRLESGKIRDYPETLKYYRSLTFSLNADRSEETSMHGKWLDVYIPLKEHIDSAEIHILGNRSKDDPLKYMGPKSYESFHFVFNPPLSFPLSFENELLDVVYDSIETHHGISRDSMDIHYFQWEFHLSQPDQGSIARIELEITPTVKEIIENDWFTRTYDQFVCEMITDGKKGRLVVFEIERDDTYNSRRLFRQNR